MQSFAEVLADELARLEPTAMPPASAFALPRPSFELGLMAALTEAFSVCEVETVVPPPAPTAPAPAPRREAAVDRLLRGFLEQHVEPIIETFELDLFEE